MTVQLPLIGVTDCERAYTLLTEYPENIVGSFWVMCGYGFEDENIPSWWSDLVVQENQAKAILDAEGMRLFPRSTQKSIIFRFLHNYCCKS